jgi:hypothetical protein
MSNNYRLCVRINNTFYYYPCRWKDEMEVYRKKQWVKVIDTQHKNKYNDSIFELKG